MGHIKEPIDVNLIVDPTPLTKEERIRISEYIAYYKRTGKKMPVPKSSLKKRAVRNGKRKAARIENRVKNL